MDIKQSSSYHKGRGAQINTANPYHRLVYDPDPGYQQNEKGQIPTEYIKVHPKTIINKVSSPDIPMDYSINPYQGCEHGCVYCYARNTHPYWGYSAGMEFEQKILIKKDAASLLEQKLKSPNWKASPIMLSGNTDCYQPAEQKYGITREILKVLLKYGHPVGVITKNSLVLRDLDILRQLSSKNLAQVCISITTLDEELRRFLEPRTSSVKNRLHTIQTLSENDSPVTAMLAPIIPGLNDHELMEMAGKASEYGALSIGYTMVRLNGDVGPVFEDWIRKTLPDRANKVLNKIRSCHGGQLHDSRFGTRMSGEGKIAEMIRQQFQLAKKLYFQNKVVPKYDLELYEKLKHPQLKLF